MNRIIELSSREQMFKARYVLSINMGNKFELENNVERVLFHLIYHSEGGRLEHGNRYSHEICDSLGITPSYYRKILSELTRDKHIIIEGSTYLFHPMLVSEDEDEKVVLRVKSI